MKATEDTIGSVLDRLVDEYIDRLRTGSGTRKPTLSQLIRVYKPAKRDMKRLAAEYQVLADDIRGAIEGDPDLREGYDFLTNTKLGHLLAFIENIYEFLSENSRITRKRKPRKPAAQVKNLKFLAECDGVKSIDPEEIIGSKTLVCYNCKQKKIYFYESDSGFEVKGTTLQNFNEKRSYGKNFGRSKQTLQQLQDMGIMSIKQVIDKMKNKNIVATGRVNSDMILIKVSK